MKNTAKMLVGLAGATGVAYAWERYPGKDAFKLAETNPLAFLEHYHWGIISMIVARQTPKYAPILDGFGAGLIISEAGQAEPFGWNHPTFGASTVTGIILSAILALSL